MHWGLVRTIIVLPGTVLIFIPAIILLLTKDSSFPPKLITPGQIWFWLALLAAGIGFYLCVWTIKHFIKYGEGTPAPWDPPRKLVISGPYRCSRNPMITGALLLLLAEALFFHSWPIALWMILFFVGNAIYFPLVEEKGLEKRFGEEYLKYKARVPRWVPRLPPWEKSQDDKQNSILKHVVPGQKEPYMFTKHDKKGYSSPVEGIEQKTLVFGDKTLMTEFLLKKGSTLPLHTHPHEQTGYLVKGRLRLYLGTEHYQAESGDSWCIAPGVEHGAEILEDSVAIEVFSPVREDYLPK